jgi:signal transduction histidine kinase
MKEITMSVFPAMAVFTNFIVMIFCLPHKKPFRFTFIVLWAIVAANMVADIIIAGLGQDEPYRVIRELMYLPFVICLFRGSLFQKVFGFFTSMTFTTTLVMASVILAQLFMQFGDFSYWLAMLLIPIAGLVIFILLVWRFGCDLIIRLFSFGSEKEWSLYALFSAICYLIVTSIYPNLAKYTAIVLLLLFLVTWCLIILCFAIISTHEKTRQKYEVNLAREIISSGRSYYEKLTDMTEQLHILRHDYKHHLETMQKMICGGVNTEIQDYLEMLNVVIYEKGKKDYCKSRVINALFERFCERCHKEQIELQERIKLPPAGTIDDYTLCIILGNLLENAITACLRTPENEIPYIEISMRPYGQQYGIKVENSYDGVLKHEGKILYTTKKEGGLGIKSIVSVARMYHGEYVPMWDEKKFSAFVVLKLLLPTD